MTGKFITIEGIEGAGKTSAMHFIEGYLLSQRINLLSTREPGGTKMAEAMRKILLASYSEETVMPETELLLMFACRCQHLSQVIRPALKNGRWVVSDRFVDASYAYQGGGRQMSLEPIAWLDKWIVNDTQPDLTILLDVPPELGLLRAKIRGPKDRIEQEKKSFFTRAREKYLFRAEQFPERFVIINAALPPDLVNAAIEEQLAMFVERNHVT